MDYSKHYNKLINSRALRNPKTIQGEWHHIIPRSMGGTDDEKNLIKLTYKEHLIAHLLLYKIYKNSAMAFALNRMTNFKSSVKISSNIYSIIRGAHHKAVSNWSKNYMTGKKTLKNVVTGEIKRFDVNETVSNDWVGLNYGNRYKNTKSIGFQNYRTNDGVIRLKTNDPKIDKLGLKSIGCTKAATIKSAELQNSRPWYAKNPANKEFILLIPSIYKWYIECYDDEHPKRTGISAWAKSNDLKIFTKLIPKCFNKMKNGWVPDEEFYKVYKNVKENKCIK